MAQKYKASLGRNKPPEGIVKTVLSFKDSAGTRWEFDGVLTESTVKKIQQICMNELTGKVPCTGDGEAVAQQQIPSKKGSVNG